ncbi:MAG: hypothetical protein MRERC_5c036 [Mycoplasmataceae bacterium RC_NB112A]|nr:MAG: hypothetical protein MRERC_5c036 [Mycoplasmataceae bacterium RC_NB112A]
MKIIRNKRELEALEGESNSARQEREELIRNYDERLREKEEIIRSLEEGEKNI